MEGSCCKEHNNERRALLFLTRSRYQRWWLFILSALGDGLSIDACCEPPYLQATYFWPQGSFVQIFHCQGGWKKHGYSGLAWQWRAEPSQGWALAKSWSAHTRGQAPSPHGQNTISFFVDIRPTTPSQWMWLPLLITSAILTVLERLHGKRQGLTQAWLFSWRGWKPRGKEPSKKS